MSPNATRALGAAVLLVLGYVIAAQVIQGDWLAVGALVLGIVLALSETPKQEAQ